MLNKIVNFVYDHHLQFKALAAGLIIVYLIVVGNWYIDSYAMFEGSYGS